MAVVKLENIILELVSPGLWTLEARKLCPGASIRWAPASIWRQEPDPGTKRELQGAKESDKKE